jgi:hypothetical protein
MKSRQKRAPLAWAARRLPASSINSSSVYSGSDKRDATSGFDWISQSKPSTVGRPSLME